MALPAQQQHSRRLLASWREDNIKIKRHSSAPPPKIRSTTPSAPASSTATAASSSPAETYDQLSFPMPTFSKALKVIEDESYTLRSQATGRCWRAVSSSRECQFGEVLRAVEVTDEEAAASSPAYFAIKVIYFFLCCFKLLCSCRRRNAYTGVRFGVLDFFIVLSRLLRVWLPRRVYIHTSSASRKT